jgi:YD repeat-containing protein
MNRAPLSFVRGLALVLLTSFLTSTAAHADTFTHDAAGRLTSVTYPDGTRISYTYDLAGNLVSRKVSQVVFGGGGGGGGPCFIATAAYGSPLDPHVETLREFRDEWLLTNAAGAAFVDSYYATSPPIADVIARHPWLRAMTRGLLTPLVFAVAYPGWAGALVFAVLLSWLGRRHWRHRRVALGLLLAAGFVGLSNPAQAHVVSPTSYVMRPGTTENMNVDDGTGCKALITVTSLNPARLTIDGGASSTKFAEKADFTLSVPASVTTPGPVVVQVCWIGEDWPLSGCDDYNCNNPASYQVTIRTNLWGYSLNLNSGWEGEPVGTDSRELFFGEPSDLRVRGVFPLTLERYYSSRQVMEGIPTGALGPNWLHNYDWMLTTVGTSVEIYTDDGGLLRFARPPGQPNWTQELRSDLPFELVDSGPNRVLTDPRTGKSYTFDVNGRLTLVEDGKGNAHTLSYAAGRLDQVSDGLGGVLSFAYGVGGLLSSVGDGTRSVQFGHDGNGRLTSVTDAMTGVTNYTYDPAAPTDGWLTSVMRPNGNTPVTQTFGPDGKVTTQTNAYGGTWSFVPGPTGTSVTDPSGNVRLHTHDAAGRLVSFTDEAGDKTTMGYDAGNRRNRTTDRRGASSLRTYDPASGRPRTVTEADGATTTLTYAARNVNGATVYDVASVRRPDGTTISYTRDANGNELTSTGPGGAVWTSTYNARGQRTSVTNPEGGTTSMTYSANGTLATLTDDAGNVTTFTYDALRRVTLVSFADGGSFAYTYDLLDRLQTITDGLGRVWTYGYDANGNVTSVTTPDGEITTICYDNMDRETDRTDPLGRTTSKSYDAHGRIDGATDGSGNTSTRSYDVNGRLDTVTDPGGGTQNLTWTKEGSLASVTSSSGGTETYQHDTRGRTTVRMPPSCGAVGVRWNGMNQMTGRVGPMGKVTALTYEPSGQVDSIVSQIRSLRTDFDHNDLGQISSMTLSSSVTWLTEHDGQGRETKQTDPLGRETVNAYGSNNLIDTTTFQGGGSVDHDYDLAARLTAKNYSDGLSLNYTWSTEDYLISATGFDAAYDTAGQITMSNGVAIEWNDSGQIKRIDHGNGQAVDYEYYPDGCLKLMRDAQGGTTRFFYDADGRRVLVTRPNGVRTNYGYDVDGALVSISHGALADISLTRNAAKQVTSCVRNLPTQAVPTEFCWDWNFDSALQLFGVPYTDRGEMEQFGSMNFTWNLAGWLVRMFDAAANVDIHLDYDVFGFPVERTESGVTWDLSWNYATTVPSLAFEAPVGGMPVCYYYHTPAGELMYSLESGTNERLDFHYNDTGDTLFRSNSAGQTFDGYDYMPGGKLTATVGAQTEYRFRGQFGGRTFAQDITFAAVYGNKWYHAELGRFLSPTLEVAVAPTSANRYVADQNDPLSHGDWTRTVVPLNYSIGNNRTLSAVITNTPRTDPGLITTLAEQASFAFVSSFLVDDPLGPAAAPFANTDARIWLAETPSIAREFASRVKPSFFDPFPGAAPFTAGDPGFEWEEVTPRLGITYALGEERKTLLRASLDWNANEASTSTAVNEVEALSVFGYFDFTGRTVERDRSRDASPEGLLWLSNPFSKTYGPISTPGGVVGLGAPTEGLEFVDPRRYFLGARLRF